MSLMIVFLMVFSTLLTACSTGSKENVTTGSSAIETETDSDGEESNTGSSDGETTEKNIGETTEEITEESTTEKSTEIESLTIPTASGGCRGSVSGVGAIVASVAALSGLYIFKKKKNL